MMRLQIRRLFLNSECTFVSDTRSLHHQLSRRCSIKSSPQKNTRFELSDEANGAVYTISKERQDLITRGDPKIKEKLEHFHKILLHLRLKNCCFPKKISQDRLISLLGESHNVVKKSLLLWYKWEIENERKKGLTLKKNIEAPRNNAPIFEAESECSWLDYSPSRNSLSLPVGRKKIVHFYSSMMAMGLQFGQSVVFDCSYDEYMKDKFIKNTAKQLSFCIKANLKDMRPFSLHFCNLDHDGRLYYYLKKFYPHIDYDCPVKLHSCSYSDIFEKKNIVYLSPHGQYDLETYDPNDVYIVGAIVDKSDQSPFSLRKAKANDVRCARLPLEQHVQWKNGTKLLCINQVLSILLTFKNTGDWSESLLKHLPRRKLKEQQH